VERNAEALKQRLWFQIPLVYENGSRAVLAIEKSSSGFKSFAEAFAKWDATPPVAKSDGQTVGQSQPARAR
jgi:hypothetical protein